MRLAFLAMVLFVVGIAPGIAHRGHSWPIVARPQPVRTASVHRAERHPRVPTEVRLAMIWRKLDVFAPKQHVASL
jgi:hypothetical protein